MDSITYWRERKLETLKQIAEMGYVDTNRMVESFIRDNYSLIDSLAKQLLDLSGKYDNIRDLTNSNEFKNLTYQINVAINKLSQEQRTWMKDLLEFQVNSISEKTSAELGFNFFLERTELERLLNTDWVGDGSNWSYRVWKNKNSLIDALNTTVKKGILQGWSVDTMVKELAKKLHDISRSRLVALARTEAMHFINEAQRLTYMQGGVQEVEIMVAEDERTCDYCEPLDGVVKPIDSPDLPPYHPRCRCTIVPHMNSWVNPLSDVDLE